MAWKIKYLESVQKSIRKIDKQDQKRIKKYMESQIAKTENPREFGKPLKGSHSNLWRYRVGQYRIICTIDDGAVTILVVRIGHRKEVYKN